MIKNSGITYIGNAINSGHLYHFTDSLSSLWCVYIDAYTHHGIIKRSRDQGLSWYQTDDVGYVDEITIRGMYVGFRNGPVVSIYDIDEGFIIFQKSYFASNTTGGTAIGSGVIPVPELGGFAMIPPQLTSGSATHRIHDIKFGVAGGGVGGNNGLRALWGTQNNNIKNPNPAVDKIFWVASYQDPFWEAIVYDYLNDSQYGEVFPRRSGDREPIQLPLYNTVGYSYYEGFMSARNTLRGVSVQTTVSAASFFLPADNWQNGRNTAPLYIPSLAAPSREDGVHTFPVHSTPSGVQYDNLSSRAAALGTAGGYLRVGLIEPGSGIAHCQVLGPGQFAGRKFLGNFPGAVQRQRVWMPYTNGIWGMGFVGTINGVTKGGTSTIAWIWDKEPDVVPSRVVSVDGEYVVDDEAEPKRAAKINSRIYDRW